MSVVTNLHSLGRIAQKNGFSGPALGARLATEAKREFTDEQLQQAKGATTFFMKGSTQTPGADVSTAELSGRQIAKATAPQLAGLGTGGEASLVGRGAANTPATDAGATLQGAKEVRPGC